MKEKLAAIAEIKAEKQKQAYRDEETNREVHRSVSTTISNNKELSPQNEISDKPVVKLSKKDSSDWGNDASSEDSRDSSKGIVIKIIY